MAAIKKYINFRVTNEEHRAFQALVDRLKRPLGTWAREILLREMGLNPKLKDLLGAEVPGSPIEIPEPVPTPPPPAPASDTATPASPPTEVEDRFLKVFPNGVNVSGTDGRGRLQYAPEHYIAESEGPEPLPSNKSLTEYLQESPLPMSISSTTNEASKMDTPPKAIPAIDRMYQIILKRDGKEAADNWRRLREPVQANIPPHLKPFYDRIVETQGQARADFWALTQKR